MEKARWASDLHGKAWTLLWRDGESFEIDETPDVTDEDIRAAILTVVKANPGCAAKELAAPAVKGNATRVIKVRNALLKEGALVNLGGGKGGAGGGGYKLFLPGEDFAFRARKIARKIARKSIFRTGDKGTPGDRSSALPTLRRKGGRKIVESVPPLWPANNSDGTWRAYCRCGGGGDS